ncbi:MAG TPA: class I SAM-dependent methyltransferase [Paracoccaceae bacterium]|nr:class I SAM-dependent methyltransferase [Paracoccaceae bacterium]HMO72264.1 class I SAM-dependent methyltransferase [Paracoccaceae bacterium]
MSGQDAAAAVAHYATHSGALRSRYDGRPSGAWFASVRKLIPSAPCRTADIGAATGRDARWFADLGHAVTAVEPVAAFLEPARSADDRVTWLEDALPGLPRLVASGAQFDLIALSAVWHHLAPGERPRAAAALAGLVAPCGRILIALRHGPVPQGMPVHAVDEQETAAEFAARGLAEVFRCPADPVGSSERAAGISWTWLALQAAGGERCATE